MNNHKKTEELSTLLGTKPKAAWITELRDLLIQTETVTDVHAFQADYDGLLSYSKKHDIRGFIIMAFRRDMPNHIVARYTAPACGIHFDICGSAASTVATRFFERPAQICIEYLTPEGGSIVPITIHTDSIELFSTNRLIEENPEKAA